MANMLIVPLLAVVMSVTSTASADVVTEWNDAALNAIRIRSTPPPLAARNLAIVHLAIYDAVNGIRRTHEPYRVRSTPPLPASAAAAATAAAHEALSSLYPADRAAFDVLSATILDRIPEGPRKRNGIAWGSNVGAQIVAARANDGSAAQLVWPGSEEPGKWRPTISFGGVVRPALLPLWGQVWPFAMRSGVQFRPPPALSSWRYAVELSYVKRIGALDSMARTLEQTQVAQFWGYGAGTATPAGHWNQIAQVVAESEGNSLAENARMFALLNIALADAAIVSWDCKYIFNLWRPITAIQLADSDENSWTAPDPAWMPLLATPPFPEYTSGHSTFSSAAAVVLGFFYQRDRIPFSVGSDDLPGIVRVYDGFWEAAVESGISRVYGGIHFPSANIQGLLTGAETGAYVVRHYLRSKSAHGHAGF